MIPKNITRENVLAALKRIDEHGVPKAKKATKFLLMHEGKDYPPKYAISLANKFANKRELMSDEFSGGKESNDFLRKFDFEIVSKSSLERQQPSNDDQAVFVSKSDAKHGPISTPVDSKPRNKSKPFPHDQRCSDCKNAILEMLRRLYGEVKIEHKFGIIFPREDPREQPFLDQLNEIKKALEAFRGFKDFAKAKTAPRCDAYIPNPGLIVEMDESQHFTQPRRVALTKYPEGFNVGYDVQEWMACCDSIDATDNDPVYRDEQRAWYDTLRDFLPTVMKLKPTVRVQMGSFPWCSLNPNEDTDLKKFAKMIPGLPNRESQNPGIDETSSSKLRIATVCIELKGDSYYEDRLDLLQEVTKKFASDVDLFIFPAGYFYLEEGYEEFSTDIEHDLKEALLQSDSPATLAIGIDASDQRDQLAIALNRDGILARARKFFPTDDERGNINLADDPFVGEIGQPRTFMLKGKKAYLAICYDSFGIRKKKVKRPAVDLIVNLVHGFYPPSEGGSGDVYFAKHGFAGSSKQWRCPTFAAAVFFDRKVPTNWPTGVMWNQGSKSTQNWKYSENAISQPSTQIVTYSNSAEKAVIRIFDY